MKTHPIQTTFAGGEISPRLHSRTDAEFYPASLAECKNFVVTPQGSVYKRNGSEYIIDADDRNTVTRIETFSQAVGEDIIVEFGDNFIRLINRDGPVADIENVIQNNDFRNGFLHWEVTTKEQGRPEYPWDEDDWILPPILPGVSTMETSYWSQTEITQRTVHFKQEITLQDPSISSVFTTQLSFVSFDDDRTHTFEYFIKIGNTRGSSEYLDYAYEVTLAPDGVGEIYVDETFDTSGVGIVWLTMGVDIEPLAPPGLLPYIAQSYNIGMRIVNAGVGTPVEFPSPWTAAQVPDVQIAMDTGSKLMIFAHENVQPHALIVSPLTGDFEFIPMSFDQETPPDWEDENWPACPAFFQGRLWFGRSAEEQSTVWASVSGSYFDFDPEGAEQATDALKFPLATAARISWLHGGKDLIIMTDQGPYIGTSDRGIITSNDFAFDIQFSFGGAAIQPTTSGRDTIFISRDRSKVRTMFDGGDETNSDVSMDISLVAQHLFSTHGARAIEYCQDPDLQFNALVGNDIISAVYSSQEGLLGWYTQELARGLAVLDIARTFDDVGTSLWMVVHHDTGVDTIEVINASDLLDHALDSYLIVLVPPDRVIDGLDRFEGKFVSIIGLLDADSFLAGIGTRSIWPEQEVIGGQITLPEGISQQVAIGLKYSANITLHKMEFGSNTGSAQPARQRYAFIMARVVDSYPPLIRGHRAEVMDYVKPQIPIESDFVTGDLFVDALGWDGTDSKIVISQDVPLKTHITGIFGILATNAK